MRVIKKRKLEDFCALHPQGRSPLLKWYEIVRKARWSNFSQMRTTFRDVDEVKVKSGKIVAVFNIKKNDFRLIAAVHYEKTIREKGGVTKIVEGKVFLFFFLSHAEYDKEKWKSQL
jgi:mRNA interferase HigB